MKTRVIDFMRRWRNLCDKIVQYRFNRRVQNNTALNYTKNYINRFSCFDDINSQKLVFFGPPCRAHCVENMTSATKPEVHNVSYRRQRRTEPRPQSTYKENLVKLRECSIRDMQVDRLAHRQHTRTSQYFLTLPGEQSNEI